MGGLATHFRQRAMAFNALEATSDDRKRTLDSLLIDALEELGGQKIMVPGAKLRQQVVETGWRQRFDVAACLTALDRPFAKVLAEVDGVVVTPVQGSDILVGLSGAKPPDKAPPPVRSPHRGLRQDIFEAFARISAVPFVYLRERDKFVAENQAEGPSVRVPSASLEQSVASRREFAGSVSAPEQQRLLDALERSANPLAQFKQVLNANDLFRQWARFRAEKLEDTVRAWAKENHVIPRDAWFTSQRTEGDARHTLLRLAPYLTADEIRNLRIPLRAVEAMLSDAKSV